MGVDRMFEEEDKKRLTWRNLDNLFRFMAKRKGYDKKLHRYCVICEYELPFHDGECPYLKDEHVRDSIRKILGDDIDEEEKL